LNLKGLGLNTLEAVKGACSLLLGTGIDVKCSDKALGIVNGAVLLADLGTNINLSGFLGSLDTLQAIECASSFILEASLEVTSSDEAFSEIDSTIFLANAKFSSNNNSCSGKGKQDTSHFLLY
jgi:hypothetical protein